MVYPVKDKSNSARCASRWAELSVKTELIKTNIDRYGSK